ncbi:MAG: hypothetical protein RLZZ416_278 [Candidatus Parcubacteria bacterium]|jgi:hypothetical protein
MTLTAHAIVGAVLVSLVPEHPALGVSAAFASHFLVDAIPHLDYKIFSASVHPNGGAPMKYDRALLLDAIRICADGLIGMALSFALFATRDTWLLIMIGATAGILPDSLQFAYARLRKEPLASLQRFHEWMHTRHHFREHQVLGVVSQVMFVVAVAGVALYL